MTIKRAKRVSRRIQISFREKEDDAPGTGYTTNVSETGLYLATNRLCPLKTWLQLTLSDKGRSFVLQAEVARIYKVPVALRRVVPGGMGLRFLSPRDLIMALVPSIDVTDTAKLKKLPPGHFYVRYKTKEAFVGAFDRDIRRGGLMIHTFRKAEIDDIVTIIMVVPDDQTFSIEAKVVHKFDPPPSPEGKMSGDLPGGIGVEFVDRSQVLEILESVVESFR